MIKSTMRGGNTRSLADIQAEEAAAANARMATARRAESQRAGWSTADAASYSPRRSFAEIQAEEEAMRRQSGGAVRSQSMARVLAAKNGVMLSPGGEPVVAPSSAGQSLSDMGNQLKAMLGVPMPRASPNAAWQSKVNASPGRSLAEIQAEEQRAAALRLQQQQQKQHASASSANDGWVTVGGRTGQSQQQQHRQVPTQIVPGLVQPPRADPRGPSASSAMPRELQTWCIREVRKINNSGDISIFEVCYKLNDPSTVREAFAQALGSTPRVSNLASEFIRKRKELRRK